MKEPFDKYSAFLAALVTLGAAGIVALIAWSAGPGPDWIWQVLLGAGAVFLVFYSAYVLISTR